MSLFQGTRCFGLSFRDQVVLHLVLTQLLMECVKSTCGLVCIKEAKVSATCSWALLSGYVTTFLYVLTHWVSLK